MPGQLSALFCLANVAKNGGLAVVILVNLRISLRQYEWCSICNPGKCGLNRNQTTMKVRKTRFILIPKSMDMWFLLHLHFCPIMAQKVTGLKMANFGFKRLFCSRVKNCSLENLKPLVRVLWFLFWWFHFSFTEMLSFMGVLYEMLVEIRWYSNN